MTAQQNILKHLKDTYPKVFSSGALQDIKFKNDDNTIASPSSLTRYLRLLEQDKEIAVRYIGDKSTSEYRYLMKQERDNYIPTDLREPKNSNNIWKNKEVVKQMKFKTKFVYNEERNVMVEVRDYK